MPVSPWLLSIADQYRQMERRSREMLHLELADALSSQDSASKRRLVNALRELKAVNQSLKVAVLNQTHPDLLTESYCSGGANNAQIRIMRYGRWRVFFFVHFPLFDAVAISDSDLDATLVHIILETA